MLDWVVVMPNYEHYRLYCANFPLECFSHPLHTHQIAIHRRIYDHEQFKETNR